MRYIITVLNKSVFLTKHVLRLLNEERCPL
jgi:hypothetical protein